MPYAPIENYGLIGNMRTAALVGLHGDIDWLCVPHFDSPSIFAAILDDAKGGRFRLCATHASVTRKQFYWPDSSVLLTRFHTDTGLAEARDFMPVPEAGPGLGSAQVLPYLVRYIVGMDGEVELRVECTPAFDYARATHQTFIVETGAAYESPGAAFRLALSSTHPLSPIPDGAGATIRLRAGEAAVLALYVLQDGQRVVPPITRAAADDLFHRTCGWWRSWLRRSTYVGRWREQVLRSAMALKLMTFQPSGAIVAAPTCSLPSIIGGERNWDYRYTWIRDAAFTVYALMRIGYTEETVAFMRWVFDRIHELEPDGMLRPLYRLDGGHEIGESILGHLSGYRGSRPVRIGNGAADQVQLDVTGELMDSAYLYNKHAEPVSFDDWSQLRRVAEWTARNWRRPDSGVWEVRGPLRDFVYSKLMCWVAMDRAVRLAEKRSFPADIHGWRAVRNEIYLEIMSHGWSPARRAFVQAFGSDALDASVLAMPLVFFVSPQDPRILGTIDAIMAPTARGGLTTDVQVRRYAVEQTNDGLHGQEHGFNICAFWLIEALTRAGRTSPHRLEQARVLFEKMLHAANHLGLYAEQTGPRGEALGNFPQAFTHISFISAAFNLDRVLGNGAPASVS